MNHTQITFTPKLENAASVEFEQWPKSLRDLAGQLGAAAADSSKTK
jgi:hypothetical protein